MNQNTEEYKEFRRKANIRNRIYYSQPGIKKKKQIYAKKYRQENKEKISKYGYELRSKPKTQKRIREWREKNKGNLSIKEKKWREKNKERKKQVDKEYYKKRRKNKEFVKQERLRQKEFREKNSEVIKKSKRKYNQTPKGKLCGTKYNHQRMSLKKKCRFALTTEQIQEINKRDKNCVYCGSNKKLEIDHIIPLAKGGEGIFKNFVLACKKCNTSKGKKNVLVWCKEKGYKVPKIVVKTIL